MKFLSFSFLEIKNEGMGMIIQQPKREEEEVLDQGMYYICPFKYIFYNSSVKAVAVL